jgi:excisionase family DNA binding protein
MTALDESCLEALVSERKAAELLGCSVYTLRAWRTHKTELSWVRVGRLVRYELSAIRNFIEAGKVQVL